MSEHATRSIHRLPPEVVARIAAGEMIARPAAALKELAENALDAGATQIAVEVRESLDRFLRISDDGCGMTAEELGLAVERYTTSKIRSEDDLLSVTSLGFRGEALASIGEIARLTVLTRSETDEHGWQVRVEAGSVGEPTVAARAQGTTVTVEDLFFNTPVRKRFLKTASGELRLARATVSAYAVATPGVSWRYEVDGKKVLHLPGAGDLKARLAQLHGANLVEGLLPMHWQEEGLTVRGYVGVPELARAGSQHQTVFVNGRWVMAPWLGQAVRQGYGDLIPNRQNPWICLFLVCPPDQVDVNLHPTKREVRFYDERRIFVAIQRAVQSAVAKLLPKFYMPRPGTRDEAPLESQSGSPSQESSGVRGRAQGDFGDGGAGSGVGSGVRSGVGSGGGSGGGSGADLFGRDRATRQGGLAGRGDRPGGVPGGAGAGSDGLEQARRLYGPGGGGGEEPAADPSAPPGEGEDALVSLLQLHNRYILAQTHKGLLIIDQHAAHERILYEQILERMQSGEGGAQQLLFPVVVELDDQQLEFFEEIKPELLRIGFDLDGFGGGSVLVRGIPPLWRARGEADLLRDLLDEAASMGLREGETAEGLARSFACRAAIKSGEPLSVAEMNQLVDALFATRRPHGDPHGRPVFVSISLQDLDRRFGRSGVGGMH